MGKLDEVEHLKSRTRFDPETGCWIWMGTKGRGGYARVWQDGYRRAHRVMYAAVHGEIPEGLHILHSCHRRDCINPDHLRAGTHQENIQDRDQAGRHAKGSANGRAMLSEADVKAIRHLHANTKTTLQELGDAFGVSPSNVFRIITRDTWKHI